MTQLDPANIDPETGLPWPRRMDTEASARYLTDVHGLPVEKKTLENQRHAGRGIKWKFFGQKPLADRSELDRYAQHEALQDESPLSRRARERAERRAHIEAERRAALEAAQQKQHQPDKRQTQPRQARSPGRPRKKRTILRRNDIATVAAAKEPQPVA